MPFCRLGWVVAFERKSPFERTAGFINRKIPATFVVVSECSFHHVNHGSDLEERVMVGMVPWYLVIIVYDLEVGQNVLE